MLCDPFRGCQFELPTWPYDKKVYMLSRRRLAWLKRPAAGVHRDARAKQATVVAVGDSQVRKFAGVVLLLGWMSSVQAIPIQWTLTDVLFEDGGTATGLFNYDADTNAYSSISIVTTDALLAPLATFTTLLGGSATDAALVTGGGDQTGQPFLQLLYFQFPLTNAGGTLYFIDPFFPAASSFDGTCLNATCTSVDYGRIMVDGGIIGSAAPVIPVPAAAWLFGSALLAAGALRRRPG